MTEADRKIENLTQQLAEARKALLEDKHQTNYATYRNALSEAVVSMRLVLKGDQPPEYLEHAIKLVDTCLNKNENAGAHLEAWLVHWQQKAETAEHLLRSIVVDVEECVISDPGHEGCTPVYEVDGSEFTWPNLASLIEEAKKVLGDA